MIMSNASVRRLYHPVSPNRPRNATRVAHTVTRSAAGPLTHSLIEPLTLPGGRSAGLTGCAEPLASGSPRTVLGEGKPRQSFTSAGRRPACGIGIA